MPANLSEHFPAQVPPLTFYPGPSKVYPQVARYMQEAYVEGILSINHRSPAFMSICQKAVELIKIKLSVPEEYTILFVSSATESWEIIAQSLINKQSFHIYNGAFGQKWMEYTQKLHPQTSGTAFGIQQEIVAESVDVPLEAEIICLTQNETSNGTQLKDECIRSLQQKYPQKLIAVDVTSSLGGITMDFKAADIWFASVQKCLGLPAGLGLFICSPRTIERATFINENNHYNSLLFVYENILKFQTHYTPNVLNIYLLMRVMEQVNEIGEIDSLTKLRADSLYNFFEGFSQFTPLIAHAHLRSNTVLAIQAEKNMIAAMKEKAKKSGIILGNGYGSWKETTFRIANFPAISTEDIAQLKHFFSTLT
jgi:phosphoserine aminotransferase